MDLPANLIEKYRPSFPKSAAPRSEREEIIEQFRARLNEEQKRDGRPAFSYALLATRFQGISDSRLYQLFQECSAEGVRSFGAMMSYKLKNL